MLPLASWFCKPSVVGHRRITTFFFFSFFASFTVTVGRAIKGSAIDLKIEFLQQLLLLRWTPCQDLAVKRSRPKSNTQASVCRKQKEVDECDGKDAIQNARRIP